MQYRPRRHPAASAATVRAGRRAAEAHVMDVSEGGLKLMCEGLAPGDRVEVEVGRLTLSGTVRWAREGFVGLRFDRALAPATLADLLGRPRATGANGGRRGRWLAP